MMLTMPARPIEPHQTPSFKHIDIFQDLSPDEVEVLQGRATLKVVPTGAFIFSPEQPRDDLFVLQSGRVWIYYLSSAGKLLTTALCEIGHRACICSAVASYAACSGCVV